MINNKKMKILMIGPFPDPITGMSIANEMLLDGLIENGHKVEFIDSDTQKSFSSLKSQGRFNLKKVFNSIRPIAQGCSKILFNNFDVVYITPAQSYLGFMKFTPFIFAAGLKKVNCYLHFHGGFVRDMYNSLNEKKQKIVKYFFNKSSGIIVLGNSLVSMFDNIIDKRKVFVCENGIQDEFMLTEEEINEKLKSFQTKDKLEILYLSNLMESKGIMYLMKACIKLKEEKYKFHLHLAGNIEQEIEGEVKSLIEELGEFVTYHGVIKGDKKKALLKKSHIFCLPTYYPNEGQPISILEAMGNGMSIITTDQGGMIDIFKDGENGVSCKKRDVDSICQAVKKCNETLSKYAESNYHECLDKYSRKKFVSRVEGIILKKI